MEGGQSGDCLVTASDTEFMAELRAGDLLLFDSCHVASALIKFADNSPVNHCGVYVDHGVFMHVTHHDSGTPAVQKARVTDRLARYEDYHVVALRHRNADVDVGAPVVVARSRAFEAEPSAYAYLNLVALFVPAFLRSYRPRLRPDHPAAGVLERAENAFLQSIDFDQDRVTFDPPPPGTKTLTCSQFAYLCYARSSEELTIEIRDPLARYSSPARPPVRGGGSRPLSQLLDLDLHRALSEEVFYGAPDQARRGEQYLTRKLAIGAAKLIWDICWHNGSLRSDAFTSTGHVVPELVTPRDLWSSPSFESRAVLVRPPARVNSLPVH
jgi:hypothetical protein